MDTEKKQQREPRHSRSKKRVYIRVGLLVIFLVLACIAAVLGWNHYQASKTAEPRQIDTQLPTTAESFTQVSADIPLYVLLVGVDKENPQQTNFVGVAAVNRAKKQIDFIMLPDNTRVVGRKEKGIQALQDVYREGGLPLLQAVVEDMFHLPIPFYAAFTEDTFAGMIDMAGGLPMYVEKDMYHSDIDDVTDINIFQGYQLLDGKEAAGYMRYIDGQDYLSRTLRQERLVKVFYEDRARHFGITNAIFIYRFWNQVQSNISAKDMAYIAYEFRSVPVENIHFYILPGELTKSTDATHDELWTYDSVEAQKIIGTTNNAIESAPAPESKQS